MQPLTTGNWFQREGGLLFLPDGLKDVRGDLEIVVGRLMDGRTDGQTYGRTDSPCVLQDFVLLWGRSPAYLKGYN